MAAGYLYMSAGVGGVLSDQREYGLAQIILEVSCG